MRTRFSHKFPFVLFSLLLTIFVGLSGCGKRTTETTSLEARPNSVERTVNINIATAAELQELPQLGAVLAERIIEHRKRYGPFRRVEHLLVIEGISEKRYRDLKQFIDTK